MSAKMHIAVLAASLAFCGSAAADESAFAFKVENASGGPATVMVDGKQTCSLAQAAICTVTIKDTDAHTYAFALAGGASMSFEPGNLEAVDLCKIDAKGAHCMDPAGTATN